MTKFTARIAKVWNYAPPFECLAKRETSQNPCNRASHLLRLEINSWVVDVWKNDKKLLFLFSEIWTPVSF